MLPIIDAIARKRILDVDAEWELVKGLLPLGRQDKAKPLGAVRRLRGIGSVEALLRILLVHLADASSQAWLNGKLLVAMLVEKLWQYAEDFSPWGYDLPEPA